MFYATPILIKLSLKGKNYTIRALYRTGSGYLWCSKDKTPKVPWATKGSIEQY